VQIGSGFLRCPEAAIHPAWAAALARIAPEETVVSRVFSGRAGRSVATDYTRGAMASDAPIPAPYPVQRGLTATMRADAIRSGNVHGMQVWAGQSARLGRDQSAGQYATDIWNEAVSLLGQGY
ncbi:MAG: nitronate monooxygenase, partial [Haliea sp.]